MADEIKKRLGDRIPLVFRCEVFGYTYMVGESDNLWPYDPTASKSQRKNFPSECQDTARKEEYGEKHIRENDRAHDLKKPRRDGAKPADVLSARLFLWCKRIRRVLCWKTFPARVHVSVKRRLYRTRNKCHCTRPLRISPRIILNGHNIVIGGTRWTLTAVSSTVILLLLLSRGVQIKHYTSAWYFGFFFFLFFGNCSF